MEDKFPKIKKSIQDFFDDQDGSITRNNVLMIGGMVMVLSMLLADDVYAAHRTHYTHRTHSTHRSSNGGHGSHSTHYSSHSTHNDHATHNSHDSHTSHVSYSTSGPSYGSTLTQSGRDWPSLSDMQSIETPTPTATDISIPEISTALNSVSTDIPDSEINIQTPPNTPQINGNK